MFTKKSELTDIQKNYYSNANFLAKEIKKITQLIANRELEIYIKIHNIKHSKLIFLIESVINKETFSKISINEINELENKIQIYLKEFINEEFINEIFETIWIKSFCQDVIYVKNSYLRRVNSYIKQIKKEINKNYDYNSYTIESKDVDKSNYWCNLIEEINNLELYLSIIRKQYSYIWYPLFYQELFFDSSLLDDKYETIKINSLMNNLFIYLRGLVISYNLIKHHFNDTRETFFIQEKNKKEYAENYYLKTEVSKKYHCGLDMSGSVSNFNDMMEFHLKQKLGNYIKKITWNENNFNTIQLYYQKNIYIFQIYLDKIIYYIEDDNLELENNNFNIINYNESFTSMNINCNLKGKIRGLYNLKGFLIFGNENDFLEYEFNSIINNEIYFKIRFKINEIQISTNKEKNKIYYGNIFCI